MPRVKEFAALLFAAPSHHEHGLVRIENDFGKEVVHLVSGISRLNRLRPISRGFVADLDALKRHLDSGHHSGAAVDVFPVEPKKSGDPYR